MSSAPARSSRPVRSNFLFAVGTQVEVRVSGDWHPAQVRMRFFLWTPRALPVSDLHNF
jgi:hypothetical protein